MRPKDYSEQLVFGNQNKVVFDNFLSFLDLAPGGGKKNIIEMVKVNLDEIHGYLLLSNLFLSF